VRCLECRRYFCRECATEHEERLLCAECIKRLSAKRAGKGGKLAWMKGALAGALGLLLAWLFFYGIGQVLTQIPAAEDEGSTWQRR
jgi:hypothetical protein